MCWGKNTRTIYALDKDDQALITFEEVLLCARNRDLKPSLRSKYVLLMKGMCGAICSNLQHMYMYSIPTAVTSGQCM